MSSPYNKSNQHSTNNPYSNPRTKKNEFSPLQFSSPNSPNFHQRSNNYRNYRGVGYNSRHTNSFSYGDRRHQNFKNFNRNRSYSHSINEGNISQYFHPSMLEDPWADITPKISNNTDDNIEIDEKLIKEASFENTKTNGGSE